MNNSIQLDIETEIPVGLLDQAPYNPKTPIQGVFKKGLEESLDYFGMRDRLKVRPTKRGRYEILDGNQRVPLIIEKLVDAEIVRVFQIENPSVSTLAAVKSDPANKKKIAQILKQSVTFKVPCQVIEWLNPDEPFTESDAKLFAATFDRNHAKYDEIKQADLYRSIASERLKSISEERHKHIQSQLKQMIRPELPVIAPASVAGPAPDGQAQFEFAKPGEFTPTQEAPWGPSPPAEPNPQRNGSNISEQFIPMVFSISASGHTEITNSIMRSKSRIYREFRLKAALERLEKVTDNLDNIIDSTIVETALLILDKRLASEESNAK